MRNFRRNKTKDKFLCCITLNYSTSDFLACALQVRVKCITLRRSAVAGKLNTDWGEVKPTLPGPWVGPNLHSSGTQGVQRRLFITDSIALNADALTVLEDYGFFKGHIKLQIVRNISETYICPIFDLSIRRSSSCHSHVRLSRKEVLQIKGFSFHDGRLIWQRIWNRFYEKVPISLIDS